MDDSVSIIDYLVEVAAFFAHESCGKCTPCRIGTLRVLEMLKKFQNKTAIPGDVERFEAMLTHITQLSACGLGQSSSIAIFSAMEAFPAEFEDIVDTTCKEVQEVMW